MKILHLYSGNLYGGVERMLILLPELDAADCEHHFALCFEGKLAQVLRARGAAVEILPEARVRNPLSVWRVRATLSRLLAKQRFDAVICHSIWVYCVFAAAVTRAGYARILYLHDFPDAKNWYYRWAWRNPPRLCIANSNYTAQATATLRPSVPLEVVYPLVNPPPTTSTALVHDVRSRLGAAPQDVVILLASRLAPLKGHRNLLRALHMLEDIEGWRCWIAGAAQRPEELSYQRELEQQIDALGLAKRVSFIGHRDDMEAILAASDIYCQPNETPETFGIVFVEAQYAGKPVVTTALGGALEVLTEQSGILCPPGADHVASALRRLLEDEQLRSRMSAAAPARAAQLCGKEQFSSHLRNALKPLIG
jgi:glycosyltransferase involved in cell wall biosynthesis